MARKIDYISAAQTGGDVYSGSKAPVTVITSLCGQTGGLLLTHSGNPWLHVGFTPAPFVAASNLFFR
ncbi:MAG: hypothetical protein WA734_04660 [Candidatus Acidiferrales bacterium]